MATTDWTPQQRAREAILGVIPLFVLTLAVAWLAMRVRADQFDPNDPANSNLVVADQLRRQMWNLRQVLDARLGAGEITEQKENDEIKKRADAIMSHININQIDPADAAIYADISRDAGRWDQAIKLYSDARELATVKKDEGLRVRYSLRQAEALGKQGQVKEAVEMAKKAMDCPDYAKAQILLMTYLEVVPACRDKGVNDQLVTLLQQAIQEDNQAKVDATSKEGSAYARFKPLHQHRASILLGELQKGK